MFNSLNRLNKDEDMLYSTKVVNILLYNFHSPLQHFTFIPELADCIMYNASYPCPALMLETGFGNVQVDVLISCLSKLVWYELMALERKESKTYSREYSLNYGLI